jgi:peptidoglycan/xylan/chitin deacetylase (PgdA/CDA1 family)
MFYKVKTPGWVKKLFKRIVWHIPKAKKVLYLTFDDGPHPEVTHFVLDQLQQYKARATFFCIGKNVVDNPLIFNRILQEEHAIGNHTHNHLNGWKTSNDVYFQNIKEASKYIDSNLFRPPYGKITVKQYKQLQKQHKPLKMVMWDVLSGDFDVNITADKCCKNVLKSAESGSVIVFHDSEKAFERLKYALPKVLKYFSEKGYQFEKIGS